MAKLTKMASILILNWSSSEQRWADQMSRILNEEVDQVVVEINEDGVQVFEVPKSISVFKPNAYTPQEIGLGPYHHFRPQLYLKQRFKLAKARAVWKPDQNPNHFREMIDELKALEPNIRAFYHQYLDLDPNTLASLFAIDGLFLLDILHDSTGCYSPPDTSSSESSRENSGDDKDDSAITRDILMLENQIPIILLERIESTLDSHRRSSCDHYRFFEMLKSFCRKHSPLELAEAPPTECLNKLHLLGLMHSLIVNKPTVVLVFEGKFVPPGGSMNFWKWIVGVLVSVLANIGISGIESILMPLMFIESLPWDMISSLLGKEKCDNCGTEGEAPKVERIKIPSVSQLSNLAKISFHSEGTRHIWDIRFSAKRDSFFSLPPITLNDSSEVILRNLVAYESTKRQDSRYESTKRQDSRIKFTDYVDLMSGIIHSEKDVRLLREKEIIRGNLDDEKIFHLFNGMNKSSGKPKSGLQDTIDEINEYFDNNPKVKLYKLWKKLGHASLKFLFAFTTILAVLALALNTFCQAYGCSRFW